MSPPVTPASETGKSGIGKEADSRFPGLRDPYSALTIQFSCWFHGMRQESHQQRQVVFLDGSCSSRLFHNFSVPLTFAQGSANILFSIQTHSRSNFWIPLPSLLGVLLLQGHENSLCCSAGNLFTLRIFGAEDLNKVKNSTPFSLTLS